MATLSGVTVADKNSPFDSGAALLLSQKCDVSEVISLSSGAEIEVRQSIPYVVGRIKGASNTMDAFNESHETIQQGLDLLSIQGKAHLSTRNAADECLIWWREPSAQVLRIVSVVDLSVTVGTPTIVVTDKNGKVRQQPPVPQIIYHESLRYIRLSQVTDDLFDAFRNMYLAFELLLEHITPKKKNEKEGVWLKRALQAIDCAVPLSRVFTPITSNIVLDIYNQIYVDLRCSIFHAKSKPWLLPQNLVDRKKVNEGLKKLTRIVLLIAEHWLHARRAIGVLTHAGFDSMTVPILIDSEVLVSDSDVALDRTETLESPAYKNAIPMTTRHAPDLSEPGLNFVLGFIDTSQLKTLRRIARLGLKHSGKLIMDATIEAELTHDGIDRLEAQLGIQLRNVREPKHFFRT